MLSRDDAQDLGLCDNTSKVDPQRDTALLQAHVQAGCKVTLDLRIKFSV
jgi:hypothetical protein